MDWEEACQILGVSQTASAADIRNQYLYKAQLLHPDKTANSPPLIRQKAEEELKRVNAAYDFLRKSHNRPRTSLPKLEVSPSHIRFNLDLNQKKTTTIRINSIGGLFTKFWMDDSPAPWLRVAEVKSLTDSPLPMEVTLEATGVEIPGGSSDCQLLIRVENENNNTKFEAKPRIELRVNPSNGEQNTPQELQQTSISNTGLFPNWFKAFFLIGVLTGIGIGASFYLKTYIPMWILIGSSLIFSIQRWYYYLAIKYKILGMLYRLILNLSILSLLGVLVWSGINLFSQRLGPTPLIGSLYFFAEFFIFIWLSTVISKNRNHQPGLMITILFLVFAFVVLAFAGVEPFTGYKDSLLSIFK